MDLGAKFGVTVGSDSDSSDAEFAPENEEQDSEGTSADSCRCPPPPRDTLNMRVGKALSCIHALYFAGALFTHNMYCLSCFACFFLRGGGGGVC